MSKILNGKIVANDIAEKLKEEILQNAHKLTLGIIQVGDHSSSSVYIQYKVKMAAKLGVKVRHQKLPLDINQEELLVILDKWNNDPQVTGYIVQLPLPPQLNSDQVMNAIHPHKDVDGLTLVNKGALLANQPAILPATTRGIISLVDFYNINLRGQHLVVLGRSNLVGLPTAIALLHRHATVTILHSKSQNIEAILQTADVVVTAIGKPRFLTRNMFSPKTVVIDVGITSIEGKLYGDVDFDQSNDVVKAITPVPGGIGPLTVISLFQNLVDLANR